MTFLSVLAILKRIKFNYNKGFLRSIYVLSKRTLTDTSIQAQYSIIYLYNKFIFGACDLFNRELHDCYLPHRIEVVVMVGANMEKMAK